MLLVLMLACAGKEAGEESSPAPTVAWLVPQPDATVSAGDLSTALIVENLALEEPLMHNTGEPIGYLALSLDGALVLETGETNPVIAVDVGEHTLSAQLFYTDGDEVRASAEALCEEDDETCAPVIAEVGFLAVQE